MERVYLILFANIFMLCLSVGVSSRSTENTCFPNLQNNSLAPDIDDCSLYHVCYNGEYAGKPRKCGLLGQQFDVLKRACAANAICFSSSLDCKKIKGTPRVPSKDSCRQFYNCEEEGQLETCPENTPFFDSVHLTCRTESVNLSCYPLSSKTHVSPPIQTTDPTDPTTPSVEPTITTTLPTIPTEGPTTTLKPPVNTCQPNIDFMDPLPDPTDCTKRVYCQNGEVINESSCPTGWNFDYIYLSCIVNGTCFPGLSISCSTHGSEEHPLVPHPQYCRQYYDCSSANPREHKVGRACQEPTPFFDYRLRKCDQAENVLCYPGTSKDIPPPPDKL